jgi:predicted membrane protein
MNRFSKSKSVWEALSAFVLMAGASLGMCWAISSFDRFMAPIGVLFFTLIFLFLFIAGAVWTGLIVGRSRCGLPNSHDTHYGVVFALLLIVAGKLLLCFNAGFLPEVWKSFFFSWPMLLFVAGAIGICRFHFFGGFVLAMTGMFFLLPRAAAIYPDEPLYELVTATYWPALIIFLGAVIFFSILRHKRRFSGNPLHEKPWKNKCRGNKYSAVSEENEDGKINYECTFGSIEQVILEPQFKGGSIKTVCGSIELDLRHTSLPDGETHLRVHTCMGGVEIMVPLDWTVEVTSKVMAGGVDNHRKNAPQANPAKKLVIIAECILGGIEIR